MLTRKLGKSGIEVSAVGLGCWAIGGPLLWLKDGERRPLSWGEVEDDESIRAIHEALDLGVNFFDTADAYGCGRSERVLGRAVAGKRSQVVIATKFAGVFDEDTKTWFGHPEDTGMTPEFIRKACEASLKRLNTDYIDLYQFHWADYDATGAADLLPVLEVLVTEGKIRCYGWSTNDPERARVFARGEHCVAVQYNFNLLERNPTMLALCDQFNLASIARGPLAMGLLTGKFSRGDEIPADDVRTLWWDLQDGEQAQQVQVLEALREILTQGGRTLAQAALGWLLTQGDQVIPIPGFKNLDQARENASAMHLGPLSPDQLRQIDEIIGLNSAG